MRLVLRGTPSATTIVRLPPTRVLIRVSARSTKASNVYRGDSKLLVCGFHKSQTHFEIPLDSVRLPESLRLLTPYLAALMAFGAAWWVWHGDGSCADENSARGRGIVSRHRPPSSFSAEAKFATQVAWGIALQTSVVVATVSWLRGRWDVWRR